MSTVDLILLGLVFEKPASAYDMQKNIEYRNLNRWVKISSPSIYKKVISLYHKGYLSCDITKEGKMPEKAIYSITSEGREYFNKLMKLNANKTINVLFDFNAVIANLNKIPKDEALALITQMNANMLLSKSFMAETIPKRTHIPLCGRTIMDQQIAVLETLLTWINDFAKEFQEEL